MPISWPSSFLALQARSIDLIDLQHVLERLSIGERAVRLGAETGRDEYTAWGRTWRLDAFTGLGRRAQFDAELAGLAAVVAQLKEPLWMWRLTMAQAMVAMSEGRFETARSLADQALQIGLRGGHQTVRGRDREGNPHRRLPGRSQAASNGGHLLTHSQVLLSTALSVFSDGSAICRTYRHR